MAAAGPNIDFANLFSVRKVEVIQEVAAEELRFVLQQLMAELATVKLGPKNEEIAALRGEIELLREAKVASDESAESFRVQQEEMQATLARVQKAELERAQVLDALRAARPRTRSVTSMDADSHTSPMKRSGSNGLGRRASSQPVSIDAILDAVDELVDERLEFVAAAEMPVTQASVAAELARVESRMSQLSLSHEVMRRTLLQSSSLANDLPLSATPGSRQPSSAGSGLGLESLDAAPRAQDEARALRMHVPAGVDREQPLDEMQGDRSGESSRAIGSAASSGLEGDGTSYATGWEKPGAADIQTTAQTGTGSAELSAKVADLEDRLRALENARPANSAAPLPLPARRRTSDVLAARSMTAALQERVDQLAANLAELSEQKANLVELEEVTAEAKTRAEMLAAGQTALTDALQTLQLEMSAKADKDAIAALSIARRARVVSRTASSTPVGDIAVGDKPPHSTVVEKTSGGREPGAAEPSPHHSDHTAVQDSAGQQQRADDDRAEDAKLVAADSPDESLLDHIQELLAVKADRRELAVVRALLDSKAAASDIFNLMEIVESLKVASRRASRLIAAGNSEPLIIPDEPDTKANPRSMGANGPKRTIPALHQAAAEPHAGIQAEAEVRQAQAALDSLESRVQSLRASLENLSGLANGLAIKAHLPEPRQVYAAGVLDAQGKPNSRPELVFHKEVTFSSQEEEGRQADPPVPLDVSTEQLLQRLTKEVEGVKKQMAVQSAETAVQEERSRRAMLFRKPYAGFSCVACDQPLPGLDSQPGSFIASSVMPAALVSAGLQPKGATPAVQLPASQLAPKLPKGGWRATGSTGLDPHVLMTGRPGETRAQERSTPRSVKRL